MTEKKSSDGHLTQLALLLTDTSPFYKEMYQLFYCKAL